MACTEKGTLFFLVRGFLVSACFLVFEGAMRFDVTTPTRSCLLALLWFEVVRTEEPSSSFAESGAQFVGPAQRYPIK